MENNMLTAHQLEALDIKNNIALTANAGSGKTFVLSIRFLEILLSGNVPLRKIAAITFTEKAASELYKKIASRIEEMINSSKDPARIEKLSMIRRNLVSANISTIHSFCINLLREFPVEAQIDANFIPIDTNTAGELIEASIDEVVRISLASELDSVSLKSVIRLFSSRKTFMEEMAVLINNRKNIIELKEKIYYKNEEEIAAFLFNSFLRTTGQYFDRHLPDFLIDLGNLISNIQRQDATNTFLPGLISKYDALKNEYDAEARIIKLEALRDELLVKAGTFKKRASATMNIEDVDIHYASIREFLTDLKCITIISNHKEIETELAVTGKNLVNYFDRILEKYEQKKRSRGYLDFEDILIYAKNILEDPAIRESVWQKYDYIMIDEYQDTNEIQYEIFLPILNYLKRGNLFVVGDEKQSIYMFRDAELEVFERTKRQISDIESGKVLALPDSFRMGPEICLFTNFIFRRIFSGPDLLFNEVAHSELVCARQEIYQGGVTILLQDEEGSKEAELISRQIFKLRKDGNKWNDIAILSRKRKSFDELEESFVNNGIPYSIMGGRNFYQRQSIFDIVNYFAFLLDNNDDAALTGVLRSPFFNISDADLYEISLLPGKNFFGKLLRSTQSQLISTTERLKIMVSAAGYTEGPGLLRKMMEDSYLITYLSSKKDGVQETANIRKLMRLTIDFYSRGFKTLYDYVSFLRTSIKKTEDESQAAVADDSNTVKIMTIHQAKGLEFPVVFIFKSSEYAQKNTVRQKRITVSKNLGILTKVPIQGNYYNDYLSAPSVKLNDFISLKKGIAELKRLFYVAVTRAKDKLFITAQKKEKYAPDSFMGLLTNSLGTEFSYRGFDISGSLKFLTKTVDGYRSNTKNITLNIPVRTEVESITAESEKNSRLSKHLNIVPVIDNIKDEIISATRYSVFNQCPLKYRFTYLDGLLPVINAPVYRDNSIDEKDDNIISGTAGTKGRIIHKILQSNDPAASGFSKIMNLVKTQEPQLEDEAVRFLANDILSDLENFFNSKIYRNIRSRNGMNEYEVFFREGDYYLFGILDRIIIENDRITIIDYKTDDIPASEAAKRASEYFNQLKFYSYIIWSTFNNPCRIFFRIIFVKHPDISFEKEETPEDLKTTEQNIRMMVQSTRNDHFPPDISHCRKCIYSSDHVNCIKKEG